MDADFFPIRNFERREKEKHYVQTYFNSKMY